MACSSRLGRICVVAASKKISLRRVSDGASRSVVQRSMP
jgi:hypothetical protein